MGARPMAETCLYCVEPPLRNGIIPNGRQASHRMWLRRPNPPASTDEPLPCYHPGHVRVASSYKANVNGKTTLQKLRKNRLYSSAVFNGKNDRIVFVREENYTLPGIHIAGR